MPGHYGMMEAKGKKKMAKSQGKKAKKMAMKMPKKKMGKRSNYG
jgi:hypothetical protein